MKKSDATAESLIDQISVEPQEEPEIILLRSDMKRIVQRSVELGTEGLREIKYLVDLYYAIQKHRVAAGHKADRLEEKKLPHEMLTWVQTREKETERYIKSLLNHYAKNEATGMGQWAMNIFGVGPIISTGLLANINIERTPTASNLWAFAGFDPTKKWLKGQLRPWSASLKQVCFKVGNSFVFFKGSPKCFYGKLYTEFKEEIKAANERLDYKEQAAGYLAAKKFSHDTSSYKCYTQGMLPPLQVDLRARRKVIKIFLSHWWEEAYFRHYGVRPPAAYPISILGHSHVIDPPPQPEPRAKK
jgi:hypothetical protein